MPYHKPYWGVSSIKYVGSVVSHDADQKIPYDDVYYDTGHKVIYRYWGVVDKISPCYSGQIGKMKDTPMWEDPIKLCSEAGYL